jgi:hypothetical protein
MRTDRSRIEVYPMENGSGYGLRRFDKYGRKAAAPQKVYTRRNNARRVALQFRRLKMLGEIPIISMDLKNQPS